MISTQSQGVLRPVEALMASSVGYRFPCAQLQIYWRDRSVFSRAYGSISPGQPCTLTCQFDIASITKLWTTTALMRVAEKTGLDLDAPIYRILSEVSDRRPMQAYEDPLCPGHHISVCSDPDWVDPQQVTWRHLLTHTSGLPPWRPLFRCSSREAAIEMALGTFFCCPPGTQVLYSDIGLIWVGIALERLTGLPLRQVIEDQVILPLGITNTGFRAVAAEPTCEAPANIAPTEDCRWRGRRIWGEVHDENAARLGGVAGHAGLFSTAADLARFGQCFLEGGAPLLTSRSCQQMIRAQVEQDDSRRGLGFALRSSHPQASSFPLSNRAFGHTGFTGTSLWIDPERALVIACVANSVYYGREHDGILPFRVALHQVIVAAIRALETG